MATDIFISSRLRNWSRTIRKIDFVRAMNRASIATRDYLKQTFMGGATRGPKRLARNTGRMEQNTVARRAEKTPDGVSVGISVNVPYASIHFADRGVKRTTITPKRARALTVPILVGKNLRPPHPPQYYANTFARGNVLFAITRARGVQAIFWLRDSVTIKSRINIERDIAPFAGRAIIEEIGKEIRKAL